MRARVSKRAFAVGAMVLLCALLLLMLRTPLRIQYHRGFVKDSRSWYEAPTTIRGHLSVRWLRWTMAGRPDIGEQMKLGKQHEDALISMGYFERRTYIFTNEDRRGFVDAVHHSPLKDPLCFFAFGTNASVEILAQRDDFLRIEKTLEKFGGHR